MFESVSAWLIRIGRFVIFPFSAGLLYLLVTGITTFVEAREILRPAAILMVIQAVLFVALVTLGRTAPARAGIIVLALTLILTPEAGSTGALVAVGLLLLIVFMLDRIGHPIRINRQLVGGLNLVTILTLVIVVLFGVSNGRLEIIPSPNDRSACATENIQPTSPLPNIYVFLLDGHARQDTLLRLFEYDEEPWLATLESEGFRVDRSSHSNYAHTAWTLSSMLNFDTPQDFGPIAAQLASGRPLRLRDTIKRSAVDTILGCAGYETISTAMPMDGIAIDTADRYLDHGHVNSFEILLLQNTRLLALSEIIAPGWLDGQHRDRLEAAMDDAVALAQEPVAKPRFAWVHMLTPHMPPVWEPDGSPYPASPTSLTRNYFADNAEERNQSEAQYVEGYRSGLDYLHARMLETIKAIKAADPGAVIILFSDHGSGSRLHEDVVTSDLPERYGTLFAALTPDRPDAFQGSPITPFRIFPRLFNAYLGTNIPDPAGSDGTWFGPVSDGAGGFEMRPVSPYDLPAQ